MSQNSVMTATGFLHPGAMGVTIAAACATESLWVSAGRSDATLGRAERAGLTDARSIDELVDRADVIVSVCPPESADSLAAAVAGAGFSGTYVDANAIAPRTARRIGARFDRFVDGGIIGPPAHQAGTTRLYLCGEDADRVAQRFTGSVLDARVIPGDIGAASAVKMTYAAWTKGTAALLLSVRAVAEAEGVADSLMAEWAKSHPDLEDRSDGTASGAAPKAWRWVGEMNEIASTFEEAGLPGGFHRAAAEIYAALSEFKDNDGTTLDQVIATLLAP